MASIKSEIQCCSLPFRGNENLSTKWGSNLGRCDTLGSGRLIIIIIVTMSILHKVAVFQEVRAYFSIGGTIYHSDPVSFNPLPDEIFEVWWSTNVEKFLRIIITMKIWIFLVLIPCLLGASQHICFSSSPSWQICQTRALLCFKVDPYIRGVCVCTV